MIKKHKSDAGFWFEDVGFGSIIHWEVIDNKLYAHLSAQVSPAGFIGTATIQYKLKNDVFNLENISFKESSKW